MSLGSGCGWWAALCLPPCLTAPANPGGCHHWATVSRPVWGSQPRTIRWGLFSLVMVKLGKGSLNPPPGWITCQTTWKICSVGMRSPRLLCVMSTPSAPRNPWPGSSPMKGGKRKAYQMSGGLSVCHLWPIISNVTVYNRAKCEGGIENMLEKEVMQYDSSYFDIFLLAVLDLQCWYSYAVCKLHHWWTIALKTAVTSTF